MITEKLPLSELKDRLRWIKTNLEKSRPDWNDDYHYAIPMAGFSDYTGDMCERSNSRSLGQSFDFVTLDTSGMGSTETVIRNVDILDAIFSEYFPDFMEQVDSLKEYPVLDASLMSEMEREAENEAWKDWIYSDFLKEIISAHSAQWEINYDLNSEPEKNSDLETALDIMTESQAVKLFMELLEESGSQIIFETGGNAWIDLEKLVESLSYKTLIEIVTGVYFVVPNAVQTSLNFAKENNHGKPYFRVYPVFPGEFAHYYETCGPNVFQTFFKEIK